LLKRKAPESYNLKVSRALGTSSNPMSRDNKVGTPFKGPNYDGVGNFCIGRYLKWQIAAPIIQVFYTSLMQNTLRI
jgi:hypothetical protein